MTTRHMSDPADCGCCGCTGHTCGYDADPAPAGIDRDRRNPDRLSRAADTSPSGPPEGTPTPGNELPTPGAAPASNPSARPLGGPGSAPRLAPEDFGLERW